MIKQAFIRQVLQHAATPKLAEELWQEIETAYTEAGRHFHNLSHLEHLYSELLPLQSVFKDWETVLFSVCYHDIVYDVAQNAVSNDNEERSAEIAERHLQAIHFSPGQIQKCRQQIMATKKHEVAEDEDTNLFTDADLSILGKGWKEYAAYKNNIRKEFDVYPDFIYNAGRRKVLEVFLKMEPLFKTAHFRKLYEGKAKENIRKEILLLKG